MKKEEKKTEYGYYGFTYHYYPVLCIIVFVGLFLAIISSALFGYVGGFPIFMLIAGGVGIFLSYKYFKYKSGEKWKFIGDITKNKK